MASSLLKLKVTSSASRHLISLNLGHIRRISSCQWKLSGCLTQSDPGNVTAAGRCYTADGFYWIKIREDIAARAAHIEVGMTKYLFDIRVKGSVDSISPPSGNDLMPCPSSSVIKWSGLKISSGDELYHSIWENVDGEIEVEPFLPLKLANFSNVEYNSVTMKNVANLEKDEWFLRFSCTQKEIILLGPFISSLKDQKQHDILCTLADTTASTS